LFISWFCRRDVATLLGLLEHAEYFDPQAYNSVFEGELEKLLHRLPDVGARQGAMAMGSFDWGGYLVRSLAGAGFRDDDALQEAFHSIVIKLLVQPGRLFAGWEPQRHGPLEKRFRRSVWNAIRNLAEKSRNRRKWMVAADPAAMAERVPGRQPYSDLIDQFRQMVSQRLGRVALAILDTKLAGEQVKNLVGRAEFGTPSAFSLKRETRAIKELARQFARQTGDLTFGNMVSRALEREAATAEKRRRSMAG
jgi:hypothetical protein